MKRPFVRDLILRTFLECFHSPLRVRKLGKPGCHPSIETLEDRVVPSVFIVNELSDTHAVNLATGTDAGGKISFRSAIEAADSLGGDQTIQFDPNLFASDQTITLKLGRLSLNDPTGALTIQGPAAGVTISGNHASEVFRVATGTNATLDGLTITAGSVTGWAQDYGGGIFNNGALTLIDSTVSNNTALTPSPIELFGGYGGGIYNNVSLNMVDCVISGNTSGTGGGGIDNGEQGTANLTGCTVADNHLASDGYEVVGFGGGICNSGDVNLSACTISGNRSASGGGIFNGGSLSLRDSLLSGNVASATMYNQGFEWGSGGGVFNEGAAALYDSTFSGNSARGYGGSAHGGGFGDSNSGETVLDACTFSNNTARFGGGIGMVAEYSYYSTGYDNLQVTDCTISGNKAHSGGGVFVGGYIGGDELTLTNCTVSGNTSTDGGGAYVGLVGAMTSVNSTISGNTATSGGGVFAKESVKYTPELTLDNTIVAGNASTSQNGDVVGAVSPGSVNNLIGNGVGVIGIGNGANGNQVGTATAPIDPLLAPLGFYGGPTETMAPLPDSPAINAGDVAVIPAGVTTDQRGLPRTVNGMVDIGSVESQAATLAAPTGLAPSGLVQASTGYDEPTFSWNAVAGADHYDLSVVNDTTGQTVVSVQGIDGTSYATPAAQALMPGDAYTFYLSAFTADDSAASVASQSFTLGSLPAPADLTPGGLVAAGAGYDMPVFAWTGAGDSYTLKVVDDTTHTTAILVSSISGDSYAATASQALTPGHSYTMYVTAESSNGLVKETAQQAFTLAKLAPATSITPSGSVNAATGYDQPTFTWNAVPGASYYSLVVADNTAGSTPITIHNLATSSYSATAAQALTPGHKFTIRIYAYSTNGKAHSLGTQSFTLEKLAAPTLISPIGSIAASPSSFSWSAVNGAGSYLLSVVDDATGAVVIDDPDVSGTSYVPTASLKVGSKYTWRVAAVSTNGHAKTWSVSETFTIT